MISNFHKCLLCFALLVLSAGISKGEESCAMGGEREKRYLLYDINPGEGFNLRRDVYIRVANLVRRLSQRDHWVLVVPPWGNLYHWRDVPSGTFFPWRTFFKMADLSRWINVIEFDQFVKVNGPKIQHTFILQHYSEGWEGEWTEKYEERNCTNRHVFQYRENEKVWHGRKWGTDLVIENLKCISVQGRASTLTPLLSEDEVIRTAYLERAETILHDEYGGVNYWSARRSMRFSEYLREEAGRFRRRYLDSDDERDDTKLAEDWRDMKPKRKSGRGGPYAAIHLRRMDFVNARKDEIPSLKRAAKQINQILERQNLSTVFIASDAPLNELEELRKLILGSVFWYEPAKEIIEYGGDGAIAIVDQIIASHGRYFSGTYESTFSFRIQEEREILGFDPETTFNRLCGKKKKCEQPARWLIVY